MSTQKGNTSRTRPQKHKNRTAFKNTRYDTSHKTKAINALQVSEVCLRCKEIIEWKVKYKKYKPLSQPRKCVKCEKKNVKRAYHIMCSECAKKLQVCAKCGESKDIIQVPLSEKEQIKLDEEMKGILTSLSERKRRTFIRYLNKSSENPDKTDQRCELLNKLNALKLGDYDDDDDYDEIETSTGDSDSISEEEK